MRYRRVMAIMQQHDLFRSRQHGAQWRICRARRAAVIALSALAILAGGIVQPRVARAAPARYVLDPNHMSIGFLISHVGFEKVLGTFREAQGTFVFDEQKPAVGDIDVTIKTASCSPITTSATNTCASRIFCGRRGTPRSPFAAPRPSRPAPGPAR